MKTRPLRIALKAVHIAMCKDSSRYGINGVLFEPGGLVATDGSRLHWHALDLSDDIDGAYFVGPDVLKAMCNLKYNKEVKLDLSRGFSSITCEGETWSGESDGEFPDYRKVVPESFPAGLVLNREDLEEALHLMCGIGDTELFIEDGRLAIRVRTHIVECKTRRGLAISVENGEWTPIGINPSYLLDAIKPLSGTYVAIERGDVLDPVKVYDPEDDERYFAIVMPVRLD